MVLHVIASNFFGGPEKQILTHLVNASRSGFRIGVCVFDGKGMSTELGERAGELGIPAFSIRTDSRFDLRSLLDYKRILSGNRVNIVCSHGFKADFYTYAVSKLYPVRKVAFIRGDTSENFKVYLYTLLDRYIVKKYGHIVTLSEAQKRKLIGIGVSPKRITIISNAIDIDAVEKAASVAGGDLPSVPEDLIRSGRYIACVGRLSPEKGHSVLVEAMAEVTKVHPDIKLLMIGEGQERPVLAARIRELGLDECVVMPGFSVRAPFYMKNSLMVVNPSHSEGMPNVVLEARGLKVPVVATDVGGVSEIMTTGNGGILVPPGQPRPLADAIVKLLSDEGLRKKVVEDGYDEFKARFDSQDQTARMIRFYGSLRNHSAREAS